jgi:hypothetical protein
LICARGGMGFVLLSRRRDEINLPYCDRADMTPRLLGGSSASLPIRDIVAPSTAPKLRRRGANAKAGAPHRAHCPAYAGGDAVNAAVAAAHRLLIRWFTLLLLGILGVLGPPLELLVV